MAKFVCEKYSALSFSEDGKTEWAKFVGGVFESDDKSVIERLRAEGCRAKFGIAEVDAPAEKPAPAAKKAAPASKK